MDLIRASVRLIKIATCKDAHIFPNIPELSPRIAKFAAEKPENMNMRTIFTAIFAAALALTLNSCADRYGYVQITGYAQGGTYCVKADLGGTGKTPGYVKERIDSILSAIDNSVSGYNKSSLLSRFNAGEEIAKDGIFEELWALGDRYHEITDGAVDVWAAPLFDIWGFGFTRDSLPSPELISSAKELCDSRAKVNFNAIAQGYSSDLVADYLKGIGVRNMLVDVGGEMYGQGLNPKGKNWVIGIDSPVDGNCEPGASIQCTFTLPETACGVVTSGNYRKFYIRDGRKYAHTIDPHTGMPVTHNLLSATVISADPSSDRNATDADAFATYCMVVGLGRAQEFILANPCLEAVLIYDEGGRMKTWKSWDGE